MYRIDFMNARFCSKRVSSDFFPGGKNNLKLLKYLQNTLARQEETRKVKNSETND